MAATRRGRCFTKPRRRWRTAPENTYGKAVVDEDSCADCGACEPECPNSALSAAE
ncbi:MAG: 4Fe-4S binding protein [Acidobacteriota bacterium]